MPRNFLGYYHYVERWYCILPEEGALSFTSHAKTLKFSILIISFSPFLTFEFIILVCDMFSYYHLIPMSVLNSNKGANICCLL